MRVTCTCGQRLDVDDDLVGQVVKCPTCQNDLTVQPALEFEMPVTSPFGDAGGQAEDSSPVEAGEPRGSKSLVFGIIGMVFYAFIPVISLSVGTMKMGDEPPMAAGLAAFFLLFGGITLSIVATVLGAMGVKNPAIKRGQAIAGMVIGIVGCCVGGSCCLLSLVAAAAMARAM